MHMAQKLKRWTLDEVHSLPDDGNKYELIRGQLFVTPAPSPQHELIALRLGELLFHYVAPQHLGVVQFPRSVLRDAGSEAEPDLMVRHKPAHAVAWEKWPTPILVIEILSPYTGRRDAMDKRSFYFEAAVTEYWIVDPQHQTVRSIRADRDDLVAERELVWHPSGAAEPLRIAVPELFA